jgi:hypothetical protein
MFIFTDTRHHQMVKGIKSWASRCCNKEFEKAFKADHSEPYRTFSNRTQYFGMDVCHGCIELCHELWESEGVGKCSFKHPNTSESITVTSGEK